MPRLDGVTREPPGSETRKRSLAEDGPPDWDPMWTFLALLTGGGLAAVGGLGSGLLTNWLGAKRDTRRYSHEQEMAREARRQDRLDLAYVELGKYLSRYGDWARAIRPLIGPVPVPDPLPTEERWRIESLVIAYGSDDVRRLLGLWEEQAKKIQNADQLIQLVEQTRNPSSGLDQEAHKEQLALPGYKEALFKAEAGMRDQMRRDLASE